MAVIIEVPPRFRIVLSADATATDPRDIVIGPSGAFGDGRHESTRMCLQAIAAFAPRDPFRMFDVGSGSGILSIGAAKLGGSAVGVEIDDEANTVARAHAIRNGVDDRVRFSLDWPEGVFAVVVANILREPLVGLAPRITAALAPTGTLILAGLVATDMPDITAAYAPLLGGLRPEIFERGVWRSMVWRRRIG